MKGVPEHPRSDNGPEFVARDLRKWLATTGAKTRCIEPGSRWENGYCESFNSKLRDECLHGEIFYSIKELRVMAERWLIRYDTIGTALFAGVQITGAGCMADRSFPGAWKSGTQRTLPTFPHSRLLRRVISFYRRAKLTMPLVQKIGHSIHLPEEVASCCVCPRRGPRCHSLVPHRPLPPLRISGYIQITHDGHEKYLAGNDGTRLYLNNQDMPSPKRRYEPPRKGTSHSVEAEFAFSPNETSALDPSGETSLREGKSPGIASRWEFCGLFQTGGRYLARADRWAWSPEGRRTTERLAVQD